jgi:hypothetical protein
MWLAGLHLVCTESILHRPTSSLPVSAEYKTRLLWIFQRLMQLLFMLCCCLPQAQQQHAPRLPSVTAAGAPLQAACLTSPPHHQCRSSTSKQFHMKQHDCTALHADHNSAFLSSKWKVRTWETSLQSLSVPCSAASEGTNKSFVSPLPNINTVATQETFQTRYDWHIT